MTRKLIIKEEPELLQIAHLGNPVIRTITKEVSNITSSDIQKLISAMLATCMDVPGVGLAAPQVYKKIRLFIMIPNPKNSRAKSIVVINPKIISTGKEIKKDWEGCLSIPGIRGLVPRHTTIKVEYFDREGKKQTKTFKDFVARIFQHEYDHLDGIVFLDRTESKDLITEKEYQKILKKKSK